MLKHGCNNNILYYCQDVWRINLDLVKFYDYNKLILSLLQKLTVLRFNVKMWKSPSLLNFEIVKNQTQLKKLLFYCFLFWCSTQLAIKKWDFFEVCFNDTCWLRLNFNFQKSLQNVEVYATTKQISLSFGNFVREKKLWWTSLFSVTSSSTMNACICDH